MPSSLVYASRALLTVPGRLNLIRPTKFPGYSIQLLFPQQLSSLRMSDSAPGPVQSAVTVKLKQELKPQHLDVINESYMHNVPKGTESHFKVVVVADQFQGKSLIQRHKMVHSVLHEELESGVVHALGIVAKTPNSGLSRKIFLGHPNVWEEARIEPSSLLVCLGTEARFLDTEVWKLVSISATDKPTHEITSFETNLSLIFCR